MGLPWHVGLLRLTMLYVVAHSVASQVARVYVALLERIKQSMGEAVLISLTVKVQHCCCLTLFFASFPLRSLLFFF